MKIQIDDIQNQLIFLNKQYDIYYDNYLKLYNILMDSSNYWNDMNSKAFYDKIITQKKDLNFILVEIKEVIDLYDYIYQLYKNIGKKIEFNIGFRNKMNEQFSLYLKCIDDIIKIYNNLNIEMNDEFLLQKNHFISVRKTLIDIQDKINSILDEIDKNEHLINKRMSSINIQKLAVKDY